MAAMRYSGGEQRSGEMNRRKGCQHSRICSLGDLYSYGYKGIIGAIGVGPPVDAEDIVPAWHNSGE